MHNEITMGHSDRGTRPIRIANCSGASCDPGVHMRRQATEGPVDVITGDYLAEINLAWNSAAVASGQHPGWQATAWAGLDQTLAIAAEKRIKIIINGGALNPKGLAEKVAAKCEKEHLQLKVAYVSGDDMLAYVKNALQDGTMLLQHLDSKPDKLSQQWIDDPKRADRLMSAHAYLGARAIVRGLREGADIIICGRVADAAPVIGASWWWWDWADSNYDALARALVAGHLIECSAYVTGGNFSGFHNVPIEQLIDVGFGIVEVEESGVCVVTKHEAANGLVTRDTVMSQFLYELQGDMYLNSDVKADLTDVQVEEVGVNRVRVTGIRGHPPPPTTKLALFYNSGFKTEFVLNFTGHSTPLKARIYEMQVRHGLAKAGILPKLTQLEFQALGQPVPNAPSQLASTTSLRVYASGLTLDATNAVYLAFTDCFMQHPAGMHCSLDLRTAVPVPVFAYFPAIIPQNQLSESLHMLPSSEPIPVGPAPRFEDLAPRRSYEATGTTPYLGPTTLRPLGDLVLARSGDKGANINIGLHISDSTEEQWEWLRHLLSVKRLKELMGDDWRDSYRIERVEFERLRAVHFVVYGILDRGVSSCARLDGLGKGFAEWIRDRWVAVPVKFLKAEIMVRTKL